MLWVLIRTALSKYKMKTVFSEENYVPQQPIGSGDRVQTRLIFTVFIVL